MKSLYFGSVAVAMFLSGCIVEKGEDSKAMEFFHGRMLSRNVIQDSIIKVDFREHLSAIGEMPLQRSLGVAASFRLSVESHRNFYCIRVDRLDSSIRVSVRVLGDRRDFARYGLDNLMLIYESRHQRMDSLYQLFLEDLVRYDFYPGLDEVNYVATGGAEYILEQLDADGYKVVLGRYPGPYRGDNNFFQIVRRFHSFIPNRLVPDLRNVGRMEDLLFPVLSRDSIPDPFW